MNRLENSPKIVGRRLKTLIHENRTTNRAIAELLNVSPPLITAYINGQREISIKNALVLAHHFQVRIEWLLNIGDNPDQKETKGESK